MTSTPIAENYHLKWDSHISYMNISLANLFRNEKFADVMLLTSNSEGGAPIPAHKIILTSSSSYFASIFEINPTATSGMIHIVLPPEISRRAIKILVQYMYSGEATVPNDILNEVLRGGEILKIRGLYRNNGNNIQGQQQNKSHSSESNSTIHYSNKKTDNCAPESANQNTNTRITDRDRQQQKEFEYRNSGGFSSGTKLPKESPVIVRSPKPQSSSSKTAHQLAPGINNTSSTNTLPLTTQNISVRKDVAIDPDECHPAPSKYYEVSSRKRESHQQLQQHCTEASCRNYTSSPIESPLSSSTEIDNQNENICNSCPRGIDDLLERRENHESNLQNIYEQCEIRKSLHGNFSKKHARSSSFSSERSDNDAKVKITQIKQEPDWSLSDQRSNSPNNLMTKQSIASLDVIKTESVHSGEDQSIDRPDNDDTSYSPLTCELCSEIFTVPKDWVRHIKGHIESSSTHMLPKKKRKLTQPDEELIATLKCDLCSTFYVTPAEWVRHIQNSHTETELAMCNVEHGSTSSSSSTQSNVKKKRSPRIGEYELYLEKSCAVCNKKFPSYASMIIHSRTHINKLS